MSSFDFAEALLPRPAVVLGLRLRPYSVGHELILLQRRNALVCGEDVSGGHRPPLQNQSIIEAADVCCQSWAEFHHQPRNWWERRKVAQVWKRWEKLLLRTSELGFVKAADDFTAYRLAGSTFPPMPDREADVMCNGKDDADGRQLGGDLMARLVGYLIKNEKLKIQNEESVFDIPFGAALHLYFTDLELEGRLKIENADERSVKEKMAKHRADYAREQAAKMASDESRAPNSENSKLETRHSTLGKGGS